MNPKMRKKKYAEPLTSLNTHQVFFITTPEEMKGLIETARREGYGIKLGVGEPPFEIKKQLVTPYFHHIFLVFDAELSALGAMPTVFFS